MYKTPLYRHPNTGGNFMKDQKIDCDVHDCKHCNCDKNECELNKIKVCNCASDATKEATMCDSYKKGA